MIHMETVCSSGNHSRVGVKKFEKIDSFIWFLENSTGELRKSDLIVILHRAQQIYGYLTIEIQDYLAEKFNMSRTEISNVIKFYSYFKTEPETEYSDIVC